MTRSLVCLALLALAGPQVLEAQECRTRGNRTECRDRSRSWVVVTDRSPSRWEAARFGVRGGYDFEEGVGSAGAQLRIPVVPQLLLVPSADVFFDDGPSEWQLNADLMLRPDDLAGLYGGVGAALLSRDDPDEPGDETDTEVGYNLFVGLESGRVRGTSLRPFVEARWTGVDDYVPFRLVAGFNVPISTGR
ncbi:MAG TPA: hypothetical protein VHG51_11485 [Longimicrobiaceae bacterium]|nr:hypothetical protein [Longimicrobiaceae bacterium]